ncbi:MAG TPA: glycosyltransferase [Myxococcota bacterium]|nr:glycosyltransferase [Myxococcota bacterium]
MKVALACRGSRGDVWPVLDLAQEIKRRGDSVTLCLPRSFEAQAASRDIGDCLFFTEDSRKLMRSLQTGWFSWRSVIGWVRRVLREQFELLEMATRDADVLLCTATELAGPSLAAYRDIRYLRLAYAPILPGDQPPPVQPWQGAPRMANRLLWWGINTSAAWVVKKPLEAERRRLGLPPIDDITRHLAGSGTTLLAISPWLAPPSPAWSVPFRYTGNIRPRVGEALDDDLAEFLDAGPAPVYVGFGSVQVKRPARLVDLTMRAAEMAGCRVVLGKGWTGLDADNLPSFARQAGSAPHAELFKKVCGVVHHGGSGTVHTAARAGIPQQIVPHIVDQYYWGRRAYEMGIGPRPLSAGRLTARSLAGVFERFRSDSELHSRCRALSRAIGRENGLERALAILSISS